MAGAGVWVLPGNGFTQRSHWPQPNKQQASDASASGLLLPPQKEKLNADTRGSAGMHWMHRAGGIVIDPHPAQARHPSASLLILLYLRSTLLVAEAGYGHRAAEARQIGGLAHFGFPRVAGSSS